MTKRKNTIKCTMTRGFESGYVLAHLRPPVRTLTCESKIIKNPKSLCPPLIFMIKAVYHLNVLNSAPTRRPPITTRLTRSITVKPMMLCQSATIVHPNFYKASKPYAKTKPQIPRPETA